MEFQTLVNIIILTILVVVLAFVCLVLIGSMLNAGMWSFLPPWFEDIARQAYHLVSH